MSSLGQPQPEGTLQGAGPGPGISGPPSLAILSYASTLGQLQDQLPRLQRGVTAQLESIFHVFTKVRQDLQEHYQQVEALLQAVKACSPALDGQPVEASQGHQEAPRPNTPQLPEVRAPQVSDFKDVTSRLPDWRQRPQASWDPEPLLWQDVLTTQLWQIFADLHDKAAQPCPRVTKRVLRLERKGSELVCFVETDAGAGGPSAPILAECPASSLGGSEEEPALASPAQEPDGRARPLLKLISWDPEDLGEAWRRPDTLPQQHKRFALPRKLEKTRVLRHGEPVLAAAVSSFTRHVFTCGKGGVKVWSLVGQVAEDRFPDSHLTVPTQAPGAYLCTCVLSSNSRTLLTGGYNLGSVSVWDLAAPSLHVTVELPCPGRSCRALAADTDESLAFAAFADGSVRIWDLRDQRVVRDLSGQPSGTKSIAVKDHIVWTGGLDAQLCRWDLRMLQEPVVYLFKSQIMSLSHSPQEDWLLLGLANGQHWLHSHSSQARMAGHKDGAVLGLKFSPYGQWWVSVGMDNMVSVHSMPAGDQVFQVPEPSGALCCDVSSDNRLVVVGSVDQASVYLVTY